jgi:hypothetical protein
MAAGVSRDELENQPAEPAKSEPRLGHSLSGPDPKDLPLDALLAQLRVLLDG